MPEGWMPHTLRSILSAPLILAAFLILAILVSFSVGAMPISIASLMLGEATDLEWSVFIEIRVPRVVLSGFVGASLAISGAALQGLLRNPLADPGLIGVSSGAAVGAVIMISVGLAFPLWEWLVPYAIPTAAVVGAVACTGFLFFFAARFGRLSIASILLVGIAVNAMAGVVIGFLQYISDDAELRSLVFWMMGSFAGGNWAVVMPVALIMIASGMALLCSRRALDLVQLGEMEAKHLGVDPKRLKKRVIIASSACVGSGVALTGIVGFVGLVVPHLVRLVAGAGHRAVIPGSAMLGAALTVTADTFARTVLAPSEIPISLVTSALGAPFFLWLIARAHPK